MDLSHVNINIRSPTPIISRPKDRIKLMNSIAPTPTPFPYSLKNSTTAEMAMATPMTTHVSALTYSLKQRQSLGNTNTNTNTITHIPLFITAVYPTLDIPTITNLTIRSPTTCSIALRSNGCTLHKVARFDNLQPTLIEQSRYLHNNNSREDEVTTSLNSTSTSAAGTEEEGEELVEDTYQRAPQEKLSVWLNDYEAMDHVKNKSLSLSSLIPSTCTFAVTTTTNYGVDDDKLQFALDLEHGRTSFISNPHHRFPLPPSTQKCTDYYYPNDVYKPQPIQPCSYHHHRDDLIHPYTDSIVWNKHDLYFVPHSPPDSPVSDSIDPSSIIHHNKSAPCIIPGASSVETANFVYGDRGDDRLILTRSHMLLGESKRRWSNPEKEQNREKKIKQRAKTTPEEHDCQFEMEV